MGGVGRNRGGGSGGARSGTGPKPKPDAKKRICKKATVPAAASAVAAALTKDSQPAAGRIQGCSSFNTGYYSVTARATSERVATATTPAAHEKAKVREGSSSGGGRSWEEGAADNACRPS